jgi:lipopolysaccharide heptosyltransferase II
MLAPGRPRPRTRQPYPLVTRARQLLTGRAYAVLGGAARCFRRPVALADLATARILLLKPCCLGDVLFSTPLVRELRRALPAAHLTYGVGAHSRAALAGNPHLDALLDAGPVGSGRYRWADYADLVRRIRAGHYTACLVLERSARLALLPVLAGVPIRVGIDSGGRGFAHTVAVSARPARPESELYLDLLRALGGRPTSGALEYHPSPEATATADRLLEDRRLVDSPFVVLHAAGGTNPGMVLRRKRWPVEHFGALADRIMAAGAAVVLVGAPEDEPVAAAVAAGRSGVVNLAGALSLDQLAALARRAAVYVGNDSGPTHLAEAAGARVIALFGPSDPVVYGPRVPSALPLTAGLWCSPCFTDGQVPPCANVLCMPLLSVERVWEAVQPFLVAPVGAR